MSDLRDTRVFMAVLTHQPHRMHNTHLKVPGREFPYALVDSGPPTAPVKAASVEKSSDVSRVNKYSCVAMANICTALVHLGILCWVGASQPSSDYGNNELVRVVSCWDAEFVNASDTTGSDEKIELDIRNEYAFLEFRRKNVIQFCVVAFHLLSALFQGIPNVLYICKIKWFQDYIHDTIALNGAPKLRYIEYTFSAPLVMVAIALSFGILEIYTLVAIAALTAGCMQFGMVADLLRVYARDLHKAAQVGSKHTDLSDMQSGIVLIVYYLHVLGWIAITIPWCVLMIIYYDLKNNTFDDVCGLPATSISKMPGWVDMIAWGQLILFSSFGLVQAAQITLFKNSKSAALGATVEIIFITLSLTAKAILGLTIHSSVLF